MKLLIHSQTSTVQPLRFGMDNYFHLTLNRACNYFSILGSKLIHVNPWSVARTHVNLVGHFEWYSLISGNDIRDHRCSVVSPVPVDGPALPIYRASARTVMTTFSPIYIPAHEGLFSSHYSGVIMSAMASQITSLTIVYSTVYSGADQREHQSSASLAFVRGIHRWSVNSPHKRPVTRKMFPFDDIIMNICSSAEKHRWKITVWSEYTRNQPNRNKRVSQTRSANFCFACLVIFVHRKSSNTLVCPYEALMQFSRLKKKRVWYWL